VLFLYLHLRLRRRPDIPCAGLQPRPIFHVGGVPLGYRNMYCARRLLDLPLRLEKMVRASKIPGGGPSVCPGYM
jgi:hypothetical protein